MLSDHLHKDIYRNAAYSAQLLEKLEENGKAAGNTSDASITSTGKLFEKTLTLKLKTVYSYGFHDRLEAEHKKIYIHVLVGNKFEPLPRKHSRISRGTSNKTIVFHLR